MSTLDAVRRFINGKIRDKQSADEQWETLLWHVDQYPELANSKNAEGRKCFSHMLRYGNRELVEGMLERGAEIFPETSYTGEGMTGNALHMACATGNPHTLSALIPRLKDKQIDTPQEGGLAPIYFIVDRAARGHENPLHCLRQFLDAKADVNVLHPLGYNVLATICRSSEEPLPMELFSRIVRDTEQIDLHHDQEFQGGKNAFHYAMTNLPWAHVHELIRAGADSLALTHDGKDAFSLRCEHAQQSQYMQNLKHLLDAQNQYHTMAATEESPEAKIARYITPEGKATGDLLATLSLHVAQPLTDPRAWRGMPGGIDAGLSFAGRLLQAIPDNRAALRERIDIVSLKREQSTPREDSVLAGYIHGATTGKDASNR